MEYKTADGKVLADTDFDTMAREYENGTWTGHGPVTRGRPKVYDEDMETVSFRLPHSAISAIESVAAQTGRSKSEFFRDAIDHELLATAK